MFNQRQHLHYNYFPLHHHNHSLEYLHLMQNVSLLPTSPRLSPILYPSPVSKSPDSTHPLSVTTTLYEANKTTIDLQFTNLTKFETWAVESGVMSNMPLSPYWEAIAPATNQQPMSLHWLKLSSAELAILYQLQGHDPSIPFLLQLINQQVGYPHYKSVHLWSKEHHPDPLPIHPNSIPASPQCTSPMHVNHDSNAVKFQWGHHTLYDSLGPA
jgi:hypothetical protein